MVGLEWGYTGMGNTVVIGFHAQLLATPHKGKYIYLSRQVRDDIVIGMSA